MDTKIKICGLSRPQDVDYVNEVCPDYAGFIINVPKSRRNIDTDTLRLLTDRLCSRIVPVGVFVDADPRLIASLAEEGVIRAVQLHGSEDEAYIARLRQLTAAAAPLLIQAFKVRQPAQIRQANASSADLVLLDGGAGEGKTFDWELPAAMRRPFLLAGGLCEENICEAITRLRPYGVDISSGVETGGKKDADKIRRIVEAVRENKKGETEDV